MQPTYNFSLPCAVFGHNYIKSKKSPNSHAEIKCTNCEMVAQTDDEGNFIETRVVNRDIQVKLRKLYHLKLRTSSIDLLT